MTTYIGVAFKRMSIWSFTDIVIALATKSRRVHVELILPACNAEVHTEQALLETGICYTSVPEKGVIARHASHLLEEAGWDVLLVGVNSVTVERVRDWCDKQLGEEYDGWAMMSAIFKKLPQDPDKRTCVEVAAGGLHQAGPAALWKKAENPPKISTAMTPKALYKALRNHMMSVKIRDGKIVKISPCGSR